MKYSFPEFRLSSKENLQLTVATMSTLLGLPDAPPDYRELWQSALDQASAELTYRATIELKARKAKESVEAAKPSRIPEDAKDEIRLDVQDRARKMSVEEMLELIAIGEANLPSILPEIREFSEYRLHCWREEVTYRRRQRRY